MTLFIYFTILFILFGSLASFFMVVGHRTVHQQSFIYGRSKCDNCQKQIPNLALIPVVGYLLSHGKCAYCQKPVASIYPLSEAYFAIFSICFHLLFPNPIQLFYMSFFAILLMMAAADWAEHLIPDRFQFLLLSVVFLYHFLIDSRNFINYLPFTLFIFLLLLSLNHIYKHGIGGGDIKTLTILAFAFGPYKTTLLLLIASGLAMVHIFYYAFRNEPTPKGFPFLPYLFFAYPIIFYIL